MKTVRLQSEGVGGLTGIAQAVALLRDGGIVAFPTETVYGLGANALDPVAVAKIFAAKQRPGWDPLIVHVEGREMLDRVAVVPAGIQGRMIAKLMAAFWPGPLTLLLPRTPEVPDAVTAGRSLVGVRMPAHPIARQLIRQTGVPLAAPSANRFGGTSPTIAAHVLADLDGRIDAVLDGGPATVGVESTVVGPDPDNEQRMLVYRPGGVTLEKLEAVVGTASFALYRPAAGGEAPETQPSPGSGLRHYSPKARLVLVRGITATSGPVASSLMEAIAAAAGSDGDVGVMLPDDWDKGAARIVFRWGPWTDAEVLARLLYFGLRNLDERGAKVIVCPVPEIAGLGEAIRDRLDKAAR